MQNRRDFLKITAQIAGFFALGGANDLLAKNAQQGEKMQFLTLNNGIQMPILGLGTYQLTGASGQKAMSEAIEVGYRLLIARKCMVMKPNWERRFVQAESNAKSFLCKQNS